MKSLVFTALLAVMSLAGFAQKLNKAKDLLEKKKLTEARTEIDNFLANEKNQANSEAWYLKTKIYSALAADSTLKGTVPNARNEAFEALKKHAAIEDQEKDSAKRFMALTLDRRQPLVDLYSGYSKDGATFYNAGNFNDAYTNFKNSLEIFDFMAERGWTENAKLDTTTTLYAGISAEKANNRDEAALMYGKIAESKATGEGFIEIYKWLADYHKQKGDIAKASQYLKLGSEVYPEDMFWSGFELDMLREKGSKEELFAKYQEVVTKYPDNHLFSFNYGVEMYQAGYNADSAQRPANSEELISKATEQLQNSLKLKPDYPNANLVLGQIYYNQGVDISNVNKQIRPPQGGKLSAAQLKRKEELRGEMNKKYDEALVYFQKVDQTLGSQGKLKAEEKGFLKEAYDLMISIYEQRQDNDNVTVYTEKFNNVEKVH